MTKVPDGWQQPPSRGFRARRTPAQVPRDERDDAVPEAPARLEKRRVIGIRADAQLARMQRHAGDGEQQEGAVAPPPHSHRGVQYTTPYRITQLQTMKCQYSALSATSENLRPSTFLRNTNAASTALS